MEATLGQPLDLGDVAQGHRRIVPQTGGTFTGPELSGTLLPGASADWQILLPDGTALGDIRYTLQTDAGELLYVNHTACATAAPKSSHVSGGVRTSTPASTPFAPQPRSKPLPLDSTG